jgi:ABC-type transport system involved in cytochrome bd biosynthesis fused ATPase/permease subunit
LIQASHLLEQYDEAQLAVRTISKLVNQPAEEGRSRAGIRTPLKGHIEFEDVRFCYRGAAKPALDGVSLTVPGGNNSRHYGAQRLGQDDRGSPAADAGQQLRGIDQDRRQ